LEDLPLTRLRQTDEHTEYAGHHQHDEPPRERVRGELHDHWQPFAVAATLDDAHTMHARRGHAGSEQTVDGKHQRRERRGAREDNDLRAPDGEKYRAEPQRVEPQPVDEEAGERGDRNRDDDE